MLEKKYKWIHFKTSFFWPWANGTPTTTSARSTHPNKRSLNGLSDSNLYNLSQINVETNESKRQSASFIFESTLIDYALSTKTSFIFKSKNVECFRHFPKIWRCSGAKKCDKWTCITLLLCGYFCIVHIRIYRLFWTVNKNNVFSRIVTLFSLFMPAYRPEIETEIGVETQLIQSKLNVHVDISFPGLSCPEFGLDAVDTAGEQQASCFLLSFLCLWQLFSC